ncbi:MAG: nucleotidyltransferase domain-containing protein [Candidatus Ranarchaeia archaeon]
MVREKVAQEGITREIEYSEDHWKRFHGIRSELKIILKSINPLFPNFYGSIARGDIKPTSDIDIIFLDTKSEFQIEQFLSDLGLLLIDRKIVQATPLSVIKAQMEFKGRYDVAITWPLISFLPREVEFYYFGGIASLKDVEQEIRISGINKQLLFVEPTSSGHVETRIDDQNIASYAKKLKISVETIKERKRVLVRRDKFGRTGVFFKKNLQPEQSFGQALKELVDRNPASKRRVRMK